MKEVTLFLMTADELSALVNEHLKPSEPYDYLSEEGTGDYTCEILQSRYTTGDKAEVAYLLTKDSQYRVIPDLLLAELAARGVITWGRYLIVAA